MWTPSSATASSDTVRCIAAIVKRGAPPGRQARTSPIPSTTLAVSRTSAIAPVPRVAYQSADGPWRGHAAASSRGQPATVCVRPS